MRIGSNRFSPVSLYSVPRTAQTRAILSGIVILALTLGIATSAPAAAPYHANDEYLSDRDLLDETQKAAFNYFWEDASPHTGLAYEANYYWEDRPEVVGGTGFGIAALVVAVDRGWVSRDQAVARILKILRFLDSLEARRQFHGAFPHWVSGLTGKPMKFQNNDSAADLVETSLLMQGLLIARAYFDGPGGEEELRNIVTRLWEDIDWNFFTANQENGIHWLWSPETGFYGLRILGYNECLITYLLAISSPTHPISRKSYDYWTSGNHYQPHTVSGYRIEASPPDGEPLFTAHYSFIGIDPRGIADAFVPHGYYVRNVKQTLSNRGYCLQDAPAANRYGHDLWGLSAGMNPDGYAASAPGNDHDAVMPSAALSSMPYTPAQSLPVLRNLHSNLRQKVWGRFGPYDAVSPGRNWVSDKYLAIDQLPIVSMIENYRSGLLWTLFMSDPDVQRGLATAGLIPPELEDGFPEAVVVLNKTGTPTADATKPPQTRENREKLDETAYPETPPGPPEGYTPDAYEIARHPDTGLYSIPFWTRDGGDASFRFTDQSGQELFKADVHCEKGRNFFAFPQFARPDGKITRLDMNYGDKTFTLPVRFL